MIVPGPTSKVLLSPSELIIIIFARPLATNRLRPLNGASDSPSILHPAQSRSHTFASPIRRGTPILGK